MSKIDKTKQFEIDTLALLPLPNPNIHEVVPPTLPDKLSDAIRVAVRDLEAAENTPGYIVNMGKWYEVHNPDSPTCYVCLAGAVMARAGQGYNRIVVPGNFTEGVKRKLQALDTLRSGALHQTVRVWHIRPDYIPPIGLPKYKSVTLYAGNPALFKRDILKCADIFEKFGE